jgi:UDPglucose 6-dehydrogenase
MVRHYSVVGLGKLGASMAAAIASRGCNVIGVDVNPQVVEAVNAGCTPIQETDLATTIAANRERLRATLNVDEAILNSEVTFVIVPTPSDTRGAFSLRYAAASFSAIGRALAHKRMYHLVVLTALCCPAPRVTACCPYSNKSQGKPAVQTSASVTARNLLPWEVLSGIFCIRISI